jgi:dTDP-4-dehydrorhamnose reductase
VSPQRWLVVGGRGLLGTEVVRVLHGRDVLVPTRADADITQPGAFDDLVHGVDVVVNCAAYTKVDDAETDEAAAAAVNADGAGHLARSCAVAGVPLVHISTDYVFDGTATTPYAVDSPIAPRSAYGRTKAAGEAAVRAALPDASWIVRTAWLYGAAGPSFVRTMLELERKVPEVRVVDDQSGQPTWARDLAQQIVAMVDAGAPAGTYHGTASGETTWFGLAQKVFGLIGADTARVLPVTSADFVRPAPRPAYSVLGHDAWAAAGLAPMRSWDSALVEALPEILAVLPEPAS